MADVKLNTLPSTSSPTSTEDLLLFDESTNAGQRINYNTLADVILNKLTTKNFTLDAGSMTLPAALNSLNSNLSSLFRVKDVSVNDITIGSGGYYDVRPYYPGSQAGYSFFCGVLYYVGTVSTKDAVTITSDSNYLLGTAGAVINSVRIRYLWIRSSSFEILS